MADFRQQINRLQDEHSKNELVGLLAEKVDERVTSVNPATEAMFDRIVPDSDPPDFAVQSEDYREGLQPVAKNAIALKLLLHQQVGRPLHNKVLTLKKQDFAECITAVDAHDNGHTRDFGIHTPTTLPQDVKEFVSQPPDRSSTPESIFDPLVTFDGDYEKELSERKSENEELETASFFIYVLDCTPPVSDDNTKIWNIRREVRTKTEAEVPVIGLSPGERAAHELNENNRIYYVGSTNDLEKRIHEHNVGAAKSGVGFTTIFPPRSLDEVQPCDSRHRAKELEGERARELSSKAGVFAFSDES